MGRKTSVSITKASGVLGTDSQSFEYDGLSRLTRGLDTISSTSAEARFYFDSLSRVVEESQSYGGNTRNITHNAFTSSPATGFTFPDDRALTNTYDLLYRRTLVEETSGGADIAAWKFFGPSRIAEAALANGLTCTCMNNARTHCAVQSTVSNPAWGDVSSDRLGYDGAGRMIAKRYLPSTLNGSNGYYETTALIGFTTTFDKSSNKLFGRHLHAENRSYLYNALDSMNRLREYQRGTLATGGSTVASATTLPGADSQRSYDLDGLGNWRRTAFTPVGGSTTTEIRQHNPLNQITRTDSTRLAYDDNGNLTDDGTLLLEYDPFNRLKRVKNKSNSQTIGEYIYDAMGRRVRKVITNGGITGTLSNGTTDYLYDQNQCVEERDGSNSHTRQFIWGVYIDELIQQKTYATTGGGGLAAGEYYPLQDPHYRVMALTDDGGDVVEAYDYDPYGKRQVFSAAGTDSTWFTDDDATTDDASCRYGHQGLLHDGESGLVYNRARMLHPILGRFAQRDPLEYIDGMGVYEYEQNRATRMFDPFGLECCENGNQADEANERAKEAAKKAAEKLLDEEMKKIQQYFKELAKTPVGSKEADAIEQEINASKSKLKKLWKDAFGNEVPNLTEIAIAALGAFGNSSNCAGWYRNTMEALQGHGSCDTITNPNGGAFANCRDDILKSSDKGYIAADAFDALANAAKDACNGRCNRK